MNKLPKCDCLNFCGDDPWLDENKCEPCAAMKRERIAKAQRQAVGVKLKETIETAKRYGHVTISVGLMVEFEKYIFG